MRMCVCVDVKVFVYAIEDKMTLSRINDLEEEGWMSFISVHVYFYSALLNNNWSEF